MKISRVCAVCGKNLEVEIDDESGKILSPSAYFGKLESIKGNPEYWECSECEKA